jgi:hypothetical protein
MCVRLRGPTYQPDASSSMLVGGCRSGLLISGSKVRVLDGPPITTGTSRTSEVPADFRSAVLELGDRKDRGNPHAGSTTGAKRFDPASPHGGTFDSRSALGRGDLFDDRRIGGSLGRARKDVEIDVSSVREGSVIDAPSNDRRTRRPIRTAPIAPSRARRT